MSDLVYINHPVGEGNLAALGEPVAVDLAAISAVSLPKARIHNGLFEVPYRQVMSLLTPALHPATPAYGSLMVVNAPDSPIGAFDFAMFGVACRSGIRPRMLTLSAFASSDSAVELLRLYGIAAIRANIGTRFGYDAVVSTIRDGDGRVLAEMSTEMADVLLGTTRAIRYPQPLCAATVEGRPGLLQFDMAYEYEDAWRGPLRFNGFEGEAFSSAAIAPTDLIGGTLARANITLQQPRLLLDPEEVGLAIKLTASEKAAA
ncbi:hypothetical protein SAMN05428974_3263 [Sphingopyxis sp. YR583]|uniref:hypothetical protein n=1 Tax=Sphingopyxis sp. YR583 TaxID=1881047 RepID=UPI0008A80127|nr:hypothetical protein [Sphingopyxis sp. YR583]SEH19176.1 hypothetical protein SAMN05428974_3263 [Sphingopyxis sp. YR583]